MFRHALTITMSLLSLPLLAAEDLVIADFEADSYGDWRATGEAFGSGPAKGALPGQMSVSGFEGQRLVNSSENTLKAHLSVPLYRDKIFASVELLYASDRLTLTQQQTGDMWLLNATLYSRELAPGLVFSASVYNLLNQKFRTPGGTEHLQDSIVQDGRTFRLKFTYQF